MFALLGGWKTVIIGLAALAVVSAVGLAYKHYTDLVANNAALTARVGQMDLAIQAQDDTILAQKDAIAQWNAAALEFQAQIENLREGQIMAADERRRLNVLLSEHDLTKLVNAKPGLMERRINSGTVRIHRMLECASGTERDDCADGDRPAN